MSEKPISPLRRRMIEDMTVRTLSKRRTFSHLLQAGVDIGLGWDMCVCRAASSRGTRRNSSRPQKGPLPDPLPEPVQFILFPQASKQRIASGARLRCRHCRARVCFQDRFETRFHTQPLCSCERSHNFRMRIMLKRLFVPNVKRGSVD